MRPSPTSGLPHRIISAALVSIPFVDTCVSYARDVNAWRLFSMAGYFVLCVAYFLRPAVFARSIAEINRRTAELELVSKRRALMIMIVGIAIVFVDLTGRIIVREWRAATSSKQVTSLNGSPCIGAHQLAKHLG